CTECLAEENLGEDIDTGRKEIFSALEGHKAADPHWHSRPGCSSWPWPLLSIRFYSTHYSDQGFISTLGRGAVVQRLISPLPLQRLKLCREVQLITHKKQTD